MFPQQVNNLLYPSSPWKRYFAWANVSKCCWVSQKTLTQSNLGSPCLKAGRACYKLSYLHMNKINATPHTDVGSTSSWPTSSKTASQKTSQKAHAGCSMFKNDEQMMRAHWTQKYEPGQSYQPYRTCSRNWLFKSLIIWSSLDTDTNPGEAYWPYRIQFSQKGHSNQFRYFMSFIFLRSLDTQTHTWRILITIQNKILTKSTCSRNSMLKSLIVWSSLDTETHTRYRTGVCPATVCSRAPPVQYLVHNCQT